MLLVPHSRLSRFAPALLASLLLSVPAAASDTGLYANLLLGPAYFHNDETSGKDSGGYGVAGQFDMGARLRRWLALHASVIADDSRSISFVESALLRGEYVTTVLGLGVGATASWERWSLGLATGAQLAWHPDVINPNDGPSGAGIGPFLAVQGGYTFLEFDQFQLGARGFARFRDSKNQDDPSGYQLGLGLAVTFGSSPRDDGRSGLTATVAAQSAARETRN